MSQRAKQVLQVARQRSRHRRRYGYQTRRLIEALGVLGLGKYGYQPEAQLRRRPYQIHGTLLPKPENFRDTQEQVTQPHKPRPCHIGNALGDWQHTDGCGAQAGGEKFSWNISALKFFLSSSLVSLLGSRNKQDTIS